MAVTGGCVRTRTIEMRTSPTRTAARQLSCVRFIDDLLGGSSSGILYGCREEAVASAGVAEESGDLPTVVDVRRNSAARPARGIHGDEIAGRQQKGVLCARSGRVRVGDVAAYDVTPTVVPEQKSVDGAGEIDRCENAVGEQISVNDTFGIRKGSDDLTRIIDAYGGGVG